MNEDDAARRAGDRVSWLTIACLAILTPGAASTAETLRGLGQAALRGEEPVKDNPKLRQVCEELGEWFTQQAVLAIVFHTTLPVLLFAELLNQTVEWLLSSQRPERVQREVDKLEIEVRKQYELLEERVREEASKPMAERDKDILDVVDDFFSARKQWERAQREARDAERATRDKQGSRGSTHGPRSSVPEPPSRTPDPGPGDAPRDPAPSPSRRRGDVPSRRARRRSHLGRPIDREPDHAERADPTDPTRDTAPERPRTPPSRRADSRSSDDHGARDARPIPLSKEDLGRIDPGPPRGDEPPDRGSRGLDR